MSVHGRKVLGAACLLVLLVGIESSMKYQDALISLFQSRRPDASFGDSTALNAARVRLEAAEKAGTPPIVLVDEPLADGAVAIVRLDPKGPIGSHIVVARSGFDDVSLLRARVVIIADRARDPSLPAPTDPLVKVIWFADGEHIEEFASGARRTQGVVEVGKPPSSTRITDRVLKSAEQVLPTEVPGIGLARVIYLDGGPAGGGY